MLVSAYKDSQTAELQKKAERKYYERLRARSARNTDEFYDELHSRAKQRDASLKQRITEEEHSFRE